MDRGGRAGCRLQAWPGRRLPRDRRSASVKLGSGSAGRGAPSPGRARSSLAWRRPRRRAVAAPGDLRAPAAGALHQRAPVGRSRRPPTIRGVPWDLAAAAVKRGHFCSKRRRRTRWPPTPTGRTGGRRTWRPPPAPGSGAITQRCGTETWAGTENPANWVRCGLRLEQAMLVMP